MSAPGTEEGASPAAGEGGEDAARVRHPRSFKLRFAAQREPGRSDVSAVKPPGLPATVAGKFYARPQPTEAAEAEAERAALARIRAMFAAGPRERLPAPATSAHEYGWWAAGAGPPEGAGDRRLHRPLRDSAWLKARLLVLAHDARLARN